MSNERVYNYDYTHKVADAIPETVSTEIREAILRAHEDAVYYERSEAREDGYDAGYESGCNTDTH